MSACRRFQCFDFARCGVDARGVDNITSARAWASKLFTRSNLLHGRNWRYPGGHMGKVKASLWLLVVVLFSAVGWLDAQHSAPAGAKVFPGTTASIGGSLLVAGACSTGTATVTGATTGMQASASPAGGIDPTNGSVLGVSVLARVSSANTVTVSVCSPIAGTPTAATYNVRVTQ